jgi:hypothetical protein
MPSSYFQSCRDTKNIAFSPFPTQQSTHGNAKSIITHQFQLLNPERCHDTQYNDIQPNVTQHNNT